MTDRRTRRTAVVRGQREMYSRMVAAHALAALRHQRTWFKLPAPRIVMSAGRVSIQGEARPELFVPESVGTYAGAKLRAQAAAQLFSPGPAGKDLEHWADTELHRPASSLNHRTARFAGKPYHWRQDYTGQLKLAAGESPW